MDVIFTHSDGRFANQFLTQINLSAYEMEYSKKAHCLSLSFLKYNFFKRNNSASSIKKNTVLILQKCVDYLPNRFFIKKRATDILVNILHSMAFSNVNMRSYACGVMYRNTIKADFVVETDLEKLVSEKGVETFIIAGWPIRCWHIVEKHAEKLRKMFQFKEKYKIPAYQIIQQIHKEGYEKIIGIQIRQDDYRYFMDGKYYFLADEYIRFSEQAAQLLFPDKNVAFMITSDSPQYQLTSSKKVFLGPGNPLGKYHYISDLIALSLCDIIIAPPSTFAASASFLGNRPYLPLLCNDQQPKSSDILHNGIFDALKNSILNQIIS